MPFAFPYYRSTAPEYDVAVLWFVVQLLLPITAVPQFTTQDLSEAIFQKLLRFVRRYTDRFVHVIQHWMSIADWKWKGRWLLLLLTPAYVCNADQTSYRYDQIESFECI